MKKIFLAVILITAAWLKPALAQNNQSPILTAYYEVKNALVNTDAATAAVKATELVTALNSIDMKSVSATDMGAVMDLQRRLIADSKYISENNDIALQRERFANLSVDIFKLAKIIKLTTDAVYYNYCPMKKSYWVSDNPTIKNPYFGKQMLTCGSVKETIK